MTQTECESKRSWFLVDAEGVVLGRLASRVATILRGKHKRTFSPHLDVGDHVVVVNAQKVHLTGRKGRTSSTARTPATSAACARSAPSRCCSDIRSA